MTVTKPDENPWLPWPSDWPARRDGHDCVLCTFVREDDPDWGIRIYTGRVANGYLSVRGQIPGYCWVIWRDGHVCEPTELEQADAQQFFADLLTVGRAVEQLLHPAKMNYPILGNNIPHLEAREFRTSALPQLQNPREVPICAADGVHVSRSGLASHGRSDKQAAHAHAEADRS